MPTTFSLTRASLIWKPGHATRLRGYGVISAVAYDGTQGLPSLVPLPPIHFDRRPRRGFDFITPGASNVGNDGVLLRTFDAAPPALGWAITLTLTRDLQKANEVIAAAHEASGAVLAAIPGAGVAKVVHDVAGAVVKAIAAFSEARLVGTWVSSESDKSDLGRDWRAQHESFKTRFELDYDVSHDDPGDDD
jgi:hypothetical protein